MKKVWFWYLMAVAIVSIGTVSFNASAAMPVSVDGEHVIMLPQDAPPPKGCDPILCAEFGFMCECTTKPTK